MDKGPEEEPEDQYDPDEIFEFDATPEELADALFKDSKSDNRENG